MTERGIHKFTFMLNLGSFILVEYLTWRSLWSNWSWDPRVGVQTPAPLEIFDPRLPQNPQKGFPAIIQRCLLLGLILLDLLIIISTFGINFDRVGKSQSNGLKD